MAVKLFFKHLFTGIRRRPIQPIILTIVIMVAMIVSVIALELDDFLLGEIEEEFYAKNGSANITVTVSAGTDSRFIDSDKVLNAVREIDENANVCGIYSLPFYSGDELIMGVFTDINSVNGIFDIDYASGYKRASTKAELRKCIYITEEIAEEFNLSVDSEFTLNALGKEQTYTVFGIVKDDDIMGSYGVMIDTSAVTNVMPTSIRIMMQQLDFKPCGTVYIETSADVNDTVKALGQEFSEYVVEAAAPATGATETSIKDIIVIIVILTLLMAIMTNYACFAILTAQRKDENALFYAVGTKSYMLNALSLAEMFIYWLVGFAAGGLLSIPMAKAVGKAIGFIYSSPTVKGEYIAIAGALMLAATELGMLVFILMDKLKKFRIRKKGHQKPKNSKANAVMCVALAVVAVVCLICSIAVPTMYKQYFGIAGMVAVFLMLFFDGRTVFTMLSAKISKANKLSVPVRYAIKNASRVESQANVSGLVAMFATLIAIISIMLNFTVESNELYKRTIDADYVVINATTSACEAIRNTDGVDSGSVHEVLCGDCYAVDLQKDCILMAASDIDAYNPKFQIEKAPVGAEVVIGEGFMDGMGLEVDQHIKIAIGNDVRDLKIVGTARMNGWTIIVDADYWELKYNFVTVRGEDGYNMNKLNSNIKKSLEMYNATVLPVEKTMESAINFNNNAINSIKIVFTVMMIFMAIGLGDSIVSGYRSRRDEFDCYAGAGMNKKALLIMKISETTYSMLMGVLMAAIVFPVTFTLLHETCLGFYLNLFFL